MPHLYFLMLFFAAHRFELLLHTHKQEVQQYRPQFLKDCIQPFYLFPFAILSQILQKPKSYFLKILAPKKMDTTETFALLYFFQSFFSLSPANVSANMEFDIWKGQQISQLHFPTLRQLFQVVAIQSNQIPENNQKIN